MFSPKTSKATPNATSSPASEDGHTPSDSRCGLTIDLFGQEAVPVSQFRGRDTEKELSTNDTSGPLFTSSSPSANLQCYLENRLRDVLDLSGSPECALTWRSVDMPAGGPTCQLVASARRTLGKGSFLWPTPTATNGHPGGFSKKTCERKMAGENRPSGAKIGSDLKWEPRMLPHLKHGYPDPRISRKLMGYPKSWARCAPSATPSSRKSRQSS